MAGGVVGTAIGGFATASLASAGAQFVAAMFASLATQSLSGGLTPAMVIQSLIQALGAGGGAALGQQFAQLLVRDPVLRSAIIALGTLIGEMLMREFARYWTQQNESQRALMADPISIPSIFDPGEPDEVPEAIPSGPK